MKFNILILLYFYINICFAQSRQVDISYFKVNGKDRIDDTRLFDNAIDFITTNGGELYIPEGEYILDQNMRIRKGVNNSGYIFLAKKDFIIKMHSKAKLIYKNGFKGFRFRTTNDPNHKTLPKLDIRIEGGIINGKYNFPNRIEGNPDIWAFSAETLKKFSVINLTVEEFYGTAGVGSYLNQNFVLKNSKFINVTGNPFDYIDNHGNGVYIHSTKKFLVKNNIFINKSNRLGTVGICVEDENTGNGSIENNIVTGYDRGIHIELIKGTTNIKNNKLIGNLSGVVLWNNFGNKQIVMSNIISNQGIDKKIKPILYKSAPILLLGLNQNSGTIIQGNKIDVSELYYIPNDLLQVTSSNVKVVSNVFNDQSKLLPISIVQGGGLNSKIKNIEFINNTVKAKIALVHDGSDITINNNVLEVDELTFSFDNSNNKMFNNDIRIKHSQNKKLYGNYILK